MALVADVADVIPQVADPPRARGSTWIASDAPPFRAQAWPLLTPIPAGWHEVTEADAKRIRAQVPTAQLFLVREFPESAASAAAALATAGPSRDVGVARRPPRTPRASRMPRRPRADRTPRAPRPARPPRPGRRPRRPRAQRKPRPPRKPRAKRARNYKTTQPVGICKGPGCTCWTPGGCVGAWYLEALPAFKGSECFRGPCFSYEACVSEKCQLHPGCLVNTILQFWARQYRVVAAYAPPAAAVAEAAGRVTRRALAPLALIPGPTPPPTPPPPAGVITAGCPPGWHWVIGLGGCRCVPPEAGGFPATLAEVIACLGYDPHTGEIIA